MKNRKDPRFASWPGQTLKKCHRFVAQLKLKLAAIFERRHQMSETLIISKISVIDRFYGNENASKDSEIQVG